METLITVAAILAMIAVGVVLIHTMNSRHSARIATFHYSDVMPGTRRRSRKRRRTARRAASVAVPRRETDD
ncbi:hypothetical protein [Streptomyces sp. NBC_00829]|uniref:hypothetical protein n=1 Tax=Streptomyces sp. NBC_00829 TaxID=2903679 RepID=UPI00386CF246|nr:hypothetical protein OG293_18755 [Streptomyces sp. NBC_00829]